MEERIRERVSPSQSAPAAAFPSRQARSRRKEALRAGRATPALAAARRSSPCQAGRSRPSGVVARYACQAMLAVSSSSRGDVDNRHFPFAKSLRVRRDQLEVDEAQSQLGRDLRIRTEIIEQPNQLQLIIRVRIKPQLDGLVGLAEFDQPRDPCESLLRMTPPANIVRPVGTRAVLVRARGDIGCEFVRRRQRSPYEAKGEGKRRPRRGPNA